jgi:hypothetical protein
MLSLRETPKASDSNFPQTGSPPGLTVATQFQLELELLQKKYVIVPEAGHMMHLQKGHMLFQYEVVSFFKAP